MSGIDGLGNARASTSNAPIAESSSRAQRRGRVISGNVSAAPAEKPKNASERMKLAVENGRAINAARTANTALLASINPLYEDASQFDNGAKLEKVQSNLESSNVSMHALCAETLRLLNGLKKAEKLPAPFDSVAHMKTSLDLLSQEIKDKSRLTSALRAMTDGFKFQHIADAKSASPQQRADALAKQIEQFKNANALFSAGCTCAPHGTNSSSTADAGKFRLPEGTRPDRLCRRKHPQAVVWRLHRRISDFSETHRRQ